MIELRLRIDPTGEAREDIRAQQALPNTGEFRGKMAGWSAEKAEGFETGPATGATFLFHIGIPVQVGLEVAFARMDSDRLRFERNGSLVGGSAGLEILMGSRVMLAGTAGWTYYGYRDATLFLYGDPIPSTGGNAWRYRGRLGLTFRRSY